MAAPTVFVSSTYFNLAQIREVLARFLEGIGYNPSLAERGDFPVDPSAEPFDNCRDVVRTVADIFVLIVGRRHGSTDARTGKSITNLEYLEACAKGIPIYIFLEKIVDAQYDIWKANRNTELTIPGIDSASLFSFIDELNHLIIGYIDLNQQKR